MKTESPTRKTPKGAKVESAPKAKAKPKRAAKQTPPAPRTARGAAGSRLAVLAFSGGLDTSVILHWIRETLDCEVAVFTADLGQGEEVEEARAKALLLGVRPKHVFIEDLRDEFATDYVFPMLRAGARYEDLYPLGTAIARPLIARRQVELARSLGAHAVAHGATGKGNDQIRFELAFHALAPELQVIAPWRTWDLRGRADLMAYARKHGIPVEGASAATPPYSADANLLHISAEGRALEDPWRAVPDAVWSRTRDPASAPARGETITLGFRAGDAVSLNGRELSPRALLEDLNRIAGRNGVGRLDMVESRTTGMKSRGAYETPGGTVLLAARRGLEQLTLDREVMQLRDTLMPRYAALVYAGLWFSPERRALQALVEETSRTVYGEVRVRCARGRAEVIARRSPLSLYDAAVASFEADSDDDYQPVDAGGFIRIQALRLRLAADQAERLERLEAEQSRARKPAARGAEKGARASAKGARAVEKSAKKARK